ncbi:MAG: enoyl-CoA hydratase [Halioglobus sp.]|jgi:enoyl-CoA hydratase
MALVTFSDHTNYCLVQLDDGKANAISPQMALEINAALDLAEETTKVVILSGRPGKFSAGFDLSIMGKGGEAQTALLRDGALLAQRLLHFPAPIVVAVPGHALALGGMLLLSTDYRIGIEGDFKIGLNEVAIGMIMPYFGVVLAQFRISSAHLNRAVMQAEVYNPAGAVEAGFLDEVVAPEALMERAIAKAEQLAGLHLPSHTATKIRTRELLSAALQEAIDKELS